MSTRASGFDRMDADLYPTPAWVVDALCEHVNLNGSTVWEPACGNGQMVRAMGAAGAAVFATDLNDQGFSDMACAFDFTERQTPSLAYYDSIVTNPPYGPRGTVAEAFIERGLERLPVGGLLALLLPVDFDSAKGRARFFRDRPEFAAKIILTRRIMWFEPPAGEKRSSPSANHAWFIWVRQRVNTGAKAVTLYGPNAVEAA